MSETQTLDIVRQDAGFAAKLIDNPVETRIRTATATIDSSLFQAAEAASISDAVALKLANVFAWDIDFVLDIREGDRFTAVYEQIYQDGKYLRDGEVLAAEFVNDGKVYRAVRFVSDTGSAGYYTPDGAPMRKAFLRAPVEFTRVSSVFNPHRLHPILNLIRGHMGTDYAAPTGTPVHAAGDGRVSFAGWRGGYGNAVVLAHTNSISTLYGHMSRFARNHSRGLARPAGRRHRLCGHDRPRDRASSALRVSHERRAQESADGAIARAPNRCVRMRCKNFVATSAMPLLASWPRRSRRDCGGRGGSSRALPPRLAAARAAALPAANRGGRRSICAVRSSSV